MKDEFTNIPTIKASFMPGSIYLTQGAVDATTSEYRLKCLSRHLSGDWGCVCDDDKEANDRAVQHGGRILSAYPSDPAQPCQGFGGNTLWIVTEADRSATTILLPSEY